MGFFFLFLSIMDVVLPLLIVYFSKKFTPLAVGGLSLLLGAGAAVGISLTENKAVIFAGLFLIYCVRIMFNYSAGNSLNLAVPSEERTGYFALRDIFLYGAIAISTWLSGWLISKWNMEAAYGFLSVGFLIALILTWNGRKWIQRGRRGKNTFKRVHRADWKCNSGSCCAYVFTDRDRNRSLRHDSAVYPASGDCPGDRDFCVFEIYGGFYCD